ncbi:hypothetical protein ATE92_0753 [Ulvibacter sp. MAR_2010_11]|uniref:hypothetical protein n=1 Tax=Ulvibacter sp. MAR_2010_11 TaxID=1250229 RepID=UPI000C2C4140|nr:hypothetical protein [Ulvibacter sp. MAR_2010_11]PKA82619.1 hypothetical protein ATE92_0753 [Ulvibacter sp. MAR_2010_11]
MKIKLIIIASILFCVQEIQANVIILNGLTHSYSGVSGQTYEGQIILVNISDENQRVTFDLNEAIYDCQTGRSFVKDIAHKNSSSGWFDSSVRDIVLIPKEKYAFKYNITIPNDKTLEGSYWTTLIVNVEKPIREEVIKNIGLDTKIRYAIRLLTDINENEDVQLDFEDVVLTDNPINSEKLLDVKILNESIYIENVRLALEIYNTSGTKVLDIKTKRAKIFPEVCRDFSVDVSDLPKGTYECVLIADSRDEYTGTNLTLTIE